MATESKWLWKMTSTEKAYETYSVSYQLTLVSREPLLEEQVVLSLRHLFRKVSLLRTCFGERDGEMWLREMDQEIIDFEVLGDTRADVLHRRLQEYKFNKETGPLWCVKLRPEPNCSPDGVAREGMPGFPHMYSLFFGINHAITDGTSNIRICGFISQMLDDVLSSKFIDDNEQLGVFISDEMMQKLIKEQEAVLNADADLQRELIEGYKVLQRKQSLVKLHFEGEDKEGKSAMMTRDLDKETTSAFIKRCRAEGITVNSAFTAVANLALVDILAEEGLDQDTYSIRSDHVPNARRYLKGNASQYLGCLLLSFISMIVETPRRIGDKFWEYAKSINERLYGNIVSGKPLLEEAVKSMVDKTPDPTFEFDFCVTNMGEVTQTVEKGGNQVQVIHVIRTAAIHNVPFPVVHFVHTFRGQLVLTLTYNSFFMSYGIAEKYHDRIFHYLSKTV